MAEVGLLLFPSLTQLDLTGPFEVFARLPDSSVHLLWRSREPVTSERGLTLSPTVSYDDCPALDVLLVPGDHLLGLHRVARALRRDPHAGPGGDAAVSFDTVDPYGREQHPDFGRYLDERWNRPWDHAHLSWADFGVPPDAEGALAELAAALGRARAGQRVETGRLGGHGRTGTALALLAVMTGCPREEAVAWVRSNYCHCAVETPGQEAFVARPAAGGIS